MIVVVPLGPLLGARAPRAGYSASGRLLSSRRAGARFFCFWTL